MGRKCIQVGAKLLATYAINYRYNELAILIATSASFAKLHYKNTIASYIVKVRVKFCVLTNYSIAKLM